MTVFTTEEKMIIKFLSGMILFGAGVAGYRSIFPSEIPPNDIDLHEFRTLANEPWMEVKDSSENRKNQSLKIININTSNKADLMAIPGIGPVMAERIIRHREDYGLFNSNEDIQNVKGIGAKTYIKIKPYLKTED